MTDLYTVFGNPIAHSKSPEIHTDFAAQLGEDMIYTKREAPLEGFAEAIGVFRAEGGLGCNVTLPFKIDAHDLATDLSDAVRVSGAANTLKFDGDAIYADNTDGIGLVTDIEANLGHALRDKRILILGAGGAVRGVALPFLQANPAALCIINRTKARAEAIRDDLAPYGTIEVIDESYTDGFDIVINGTSSSLDGAMPTCPANAFDGCQLAYDMIYGKGKTPFLKGAEAAGVSHLADGVGMLVEQAARSFAIWRNKTPDTSRMIERLTVPLT